MRPPSLLVVCGIQTVLGDLEHPVGDSCQLGEEVGWGRADASRRSSCAFVVGVSIARCSLLNLRAVRGASVTRRHNRWECELRAILTVSGASALPGVEAATEPQAAVRKGVSCRSRPEEGL